MKVKLVALLAGLALAGTVVSGCGLILGIQDPEGAQPDAPTCADPCDLVTNCGCAGGTCSWDTTTAKPYCRMGNGASDRQQDCGSDSDCKNGLACVYGTCRSFCDNDTECPFRTYCTADFTPDFPKKTCSDRCDANNNLGCPTDQTCIAIQGTDSAACVPYGSFATGSNCATNVFGCVPHDVCYLQGGMLACVQLCSLSGGGTACPTGYSCVDPGDLSEDGQHIGICQ